MKGLNTYSNFQYEYIRIFFKVHFLSSSSRFIENSQLWTIDGQSRAVQLSHLCLCNLVNITVTPPTKKIDLNATSSFLDTHRNNIEENLPLRQNDAINLLAGNTFITSGCATTKM